MESQVWTTRILYAIFYHLVDSLLTLAYSDLLADNPYANTKTKASY